MSIYWSPALCKSYLCWLSCDSDYLSNNPREGSLIYFTGEENIFQIENHLLFLGVMMTKYLTETVFGRTCLRSWFQRVQTIGEITVEKNSSCQASKKRKLVLNWLPLSPFSPFSPSPNKIVPLTPRHVFSLKSVLSGNALTGVPIGVLLTIC